MNLYTNVVIRGSESKRIFDEMAKTSKKTTSNAEKRKNRLSAFAKKISDAKK